MTGRPVRSASMHACTCMDRSSRAPNAPPTPARVSRTLSAGRPRQAATCFWSTCSHWVAMNRSTPPSSAGTASPDSTPRNAWSCMPTSYRPVTTTSAVASRVAAAHRHVPDQVAAAQRGVAGLGVPGARVVVGVLVHPAAPGRRAASASVTGVQHLVVDGDPGHRPPGGLRMVGGHDRDRLTLVAHLVAGEHRLVDDLQPVAPGARHVVGGQHRVDARAGPAPGRCRPDGSGPAGTATAASRPTACRRRTGRTRTRTRPVTFSVPSGRSGLRRPHRCRRCASPARRCAVVAIAPRSSAGLDQAAVGPAGPPGQGLARPR